MQGECRIDSQGTKGKSKETGLEGACGGSHVKLVVIQTITLLNILTLSFPFVPMHTYRVAKRRIDTNNQFPITNGQTILTRS